MTENAHHPEIRSARRAVLAMRLGRLRWYWQVRSVAGLKRALDILCASAGLLLLSPLLLVVATAIRCDDGGPVLFWQRRVGRHGREFPFPKFRSMVVDAEQRLLAMQHLNQHGDGGVTFKHARDPRVTRIGRMTRRTSIDELPPALVCAQGRHDAGRAAPPAAERSGPVHPGRARAPGSHPRADLHLASQRPGRNSICRAGVDGRGVHPQALPMD